MSGCEDSVGAGPAVEMVPAPAYGFLLWEERDGTTHRLEGSVAELSAVGRALIGAGLTASCFRRGQWRVRL